MGPEDCDARILFGSVNAPGAKFSPGVCSAFCTPRAALPAAPKGTPMPLDAFFGLASMTKIMSSVAALQLTEEGR